MLDSFLLIPFIRFSSEVVSQEQRCSSYSVTSSDSTSLASTSTHSSADTWILWRLGIGSREICAVCLIKLKKEKNEVSHDLISQKRLYLQIQEESGTIECFRGSKWDLFVCSVLNQVDEGKACEVSHELISQRDSLFKFNLSLGFEFFVKAQEIVPEEVKGKVQIQVKAGIWLYKKKQSTT